MTNAVESAVAKERLWNFAEDEPPERIVLQIYADSKKYPFTVKKRGIAFYGIKCTLITA